MVATSPPRERKEDGDYWSGKRKKERRRWLREKSRQGEEQGCKEEQRWAVLKGKTVEGEQVRYFCLIFWL